MNKLEDLSEFETVQRWFEHVFGEGIRSKSTEKTYIHFIRRFCEYTKKDPDELIAERLLHLKSTEIPERRQHEELLTSWRSHLEIKEKMSRATVVTAHNTIKSFYKANYVPLVSKSPKLWATREKKVPNRQELTQMVTRCRKVRDRAVIIFLAQTGTSLRDCLELVTFELVKTELDQGIEPLHLPLERQKIKKKYDTFLGKDGIAVLKEYIGSSQWKGPIFDMSDRAVEYVVKKAAKRVNLQHVTPHCLRSFFYTFMALSFHTVQAQHIPLVDYWMGHEIPYKGAYMVPPVDEQRKLYKEHEWAVSLET